ncbi:ABC transporter substrate-binding protein [Cellulomonas sp. APG4]|uniref:ABC transporter substrate-binding protein n=1 Tax=Cellulomonas sp. APG4 TaxID=1538656 RepID=UPI00137B80C0|nr:ABC transporter substrate-binding protein [Cellulomonas sp. APG4]NCT90791.1 ABC transporter substrate-binding protein [Cellulomonas sp. APG4]
MRRAARWISAGAAVGLLAACSTGEGVDLDGDEGTGGDATGEVLVAAIAGEPDQLDPHRTSSYFSFQVLENVFDTLVEPDENLEMQPALAESWEVSDDQLTWTFDLRDGVTWHDGSDFTADDVVYSYTRIIDEELANAWRFAAVTEVSAPDDDTVVIEVAQPSPNLLSSIGGFKGMAIVQQENVESGDIVTAPVGTGPFSVADYAAGEAIDLTANADWWGGAPEVGGVTFRFVPEPTTAVAELTAGDVHWTDNVPPQQVSDLEGNDDVVVGAAASNDYWYLAANQARPPFDDVRVRQALAYAIDREAIAQVTQYGNATVNQLAIPETSGWYTAYDTYSHDPARASELLEEAGVDGLEIDMMVTSEYPETVTAAQAIASQLAEIGVTVTPRELDFATWLDEQGQGNFDLLMLSWLGNIDPDDFYYAQHHSTGSFNFQGYANPEVDALLDEARTETDEAARKDLYAEAATQIADDASYVYLYNPDVVQAWVPELEGYEARGDGAIRFRDVSLAD